VELVIEPWAAFEPNSWFSSSAPFGDEAGSVDEHGGFIAKGR
jgi:hypothetical protein